MRLRLLLSLLAVFFAQTLRAEAVAHSAPGSGCLTASVQTQPSGAGALALYRIVFQNRCDAPRLLYWCAEHAGAAVPPAVACPRPQAGGGAAAEPRHWIMVRKEFQWNLPAGARIRYLDCAGREVPTLDFDCAPVPVR